MIVRFEKYQGTGNDFVIVDNRHNQYDGLTAETIRFICDRRFGVGADGLMLLQKHPDYAFEMKYYNSDGGEATMCGNGARCICAFAGYLGVISEGTLFNFMAADGVHQARFSNGNTDLKMIDVASVALIDDGYFLNTGVPHLVKPVPDVDDVDVFHEGKTIRFADRFQPQGTNVNFITILDRDSISVRTYERGVEGETLSCGTGVVASCIAASHITGAHSFVVTVRGGMLNVHFNASADGSFSDVWLCGPAQRVFSGSIEI